MSSSKMIRVLGLFLSIIISWFNLVLSSLPRNVGCNTKWVGTGRKIKSWR